MKIIEQQFLSEQNIEPNITQKEKQTNTEIDEIYKVTENPPNEDV